MISIDVNFENMTCRCCGSPVEDAGNGFYRHSAKPDVPCALDSYNEVRGKMSKNSGILKVKVCPVCNQPLVAVYRNLKRIGYCHAPAKKGGYDL